MENIMATQLSWGKLGDSNQRSGGKVNNLKLDVGVTKVRFIGEPVEFHKYFLNGKSAVTADPKTCPIKLKYGIDPTTRYAINVIDRRDGQLKVLECPITVLKPVNAWGEMASRDPGGDNGVDFGIKVEGIGKSRKYSPVPLGDSPLTEAEKKMIKEIGGTDQGYDLSKLYKAVPEAEIEGRLFGKAVPPGTTPLTTTTQSTGNVGSVGQTVQVQNDIPF